MNLPNSITLARIFLVPVFVWLAYDPAHHFAAALVFFVAALSDFLDGYLARSRGEVTALGQLLDPIADKLLTLAGFVMLLALGLAPAWMVIVILGREVAVTGLRAIAAAEGMVMPADDWGKWKTVAQITAIIMLLLGWQVWIFDVAVIGYWVMVASMLLALYSGGRYMAAYLNAVKLRGTGA